MEAFFDESRAGVSFKILKHPQRREVATRLKVERDGKTAFELDSPLLGELWDKEWLRANEHADITKRLQRATEVLAAPVGEEHPSVGIFDLTEDTFSQQATLSMSLDGVTRRLVIQERSMTMYFAPEEACGIIALLTQAAKLWVK